MKFYFHIDVYSDIHFRQIIYLVETITYNIMTYYFPVSELEAALKFVRLVTLNVFIKTRKHMQYFSKTDSLHKLGQI